MIQGEYQPAFGESILQQRLEPTGVIWKIPVGLCRKSHYHDSLHAPFICTAISLYTVFLRAVQAVPGRFSPVCLMNEGRETPAGRIPHKRLSNLGFLACRADFGDAVHRAMDLILAAAGQICIESPPQTHVHHLYSNYTLHAFYTYNFGQKCIKW